MQRPCSSPGISVAPRTGRGYKKLSVRGAGFMPIRLTENGASRSGGMTGELRPVDGGDETNAGIL